MVLGGTKCTLCTLLTLARASGIFSMAASLGRVMMSIIIMTKCPVTEISFVL